MIFFPVLCLKPYIFSLFIEPFVFGFRWNIGVNIYITIRKLQWKRYDSETFFLVNFPQPNRLSLAANLREKVKSWPVVYRVQECLYTGNSSDIAFTYTEITYRIQFLEMRGTLKELFVYCFPHR